jgi:glycosyltransferase involved in cell wall biosynthesis
MRIFYDHQVTSLQDAGGISRYYFDLVQALPDLDAAGGRVSPELLLGFNRSVLPFSSLEPRARVTSFASAIRPGPLRYAVNEALTAAVAPLRGRVDVYHATYQRLLPSIRYDAVVVTHHDSTPDRFPHLFPDAAAIHARLRKVYARADQIICISESCRQDLLHYFPIALEKTVVIHHGFSALPAAGEDERSTMPCEQPYLLYVGSRAAYKNFPSLLRALAQQANKDVHLVAAGGGPFSVADLAEISRLRLTERVHLLPRVSETQLADLYRNAALFVYPSLYEGFGFPPLEAMSAGCPALVSCAAALPEICGDAAFYFDPASVDDLAAALARLLVDDTVRLSKLALGLEQVKRYTWHRTAAETLAVYRAALDKASAPGE